MKTRFKTLEDFYKAVEALMERLTAEHHADDARRLHVLMHQTAWTTGSELIGELMLTLKHMKGEYSPELEKEIVECREFATHHRKILKLD